MDASWTLAAVFQAHTRVSIRADPAALEEHLAKALERARAPWSTVPLFAERFVAHIAERLPDNDRGLPIEQIFESLHLEDLYLACACAAKLPVAIDLFERDVLSKIPGILRQRQFAPHVTEDVGQRLREMLLLQGHIATYGGTGKLATWVEVIAKRMANKAVRSHKPETPGLSKILPRLADTGDPEKDLIKKDLLAKLEAAVRLALAALSTEQREMLKFHYRDRLSEAELAKIFSTSQPTISRRLKATREAILQETERLLETRIGLRKEDFQSFLAEIRSRLLDMSLSQVFGSDDSNPAS